MPSNDAIYDKTHAAAASTLATIGALAAGLVPETSWKQRKMKYFSAPESVQRVRTPEEKAKRNASRAKTKARKAKRGY